MAPQGPTIGNAQFIRQNDFFHINQTSVLFNKKTLKFNSLVQKTCLFLQKETSHSKNSLALGPQEPKQYIFGDHFYSKNAKNLRFHVFLLLPEVDRIHKKL